MSLFVLSNAATPLYTIWQQRIGFSDTTLTWIFVVYIAGLLTSLLVSGPASDRVGRKPVLLPALALSFVSCLLFMTAGSVAALVAARLLTGLSGGAVVSCGIAAVIDLSGGRRAQAARLASSAIVLGSGLGPLLAGAVIGVFAEPVRPVFLLVLVLLAASVLVAVRMPLPARPRRKGRFIQMPAVPRPQLTHLVLGVAVYAPGLIGGSFFLALGPSLLHSAQPHAGALATGSLVFLAFAAATTIQFTARRLPVRDMLPASAGATFAGMACLLVAAATHQVAALCTAAVLVGVGQGAGQLGAFTLLNTSVPRERLAAANACLSISVYLPAAAFTLAAGRASDWFGIGIGTQLLAAVVMLIATVVGVMLVLWRDRVPAADRK
ncbi:MFS transporter [Streptomyces sp. S.PB5]|uniref:MFS transporter n=1 Tax=Streptomyces sp. S.PB5 TaxID=3020844 RepID=UPI0025B1F978|nr:MFS transporter [Streptomyces sp. S.PB5]MDN3029403.1 MFS transporter [Streptomyces sp. S.PB5]